MERETWQEEPESKVWRMARRLACVQELNGGVRTDSRLQRVAWEELEDAIIEMVDEEAEGGENGKNR
jgi:hypothetical protein